MKKFSMDHVPVYGVTKEQYDLWAETHDRGFTDNPIQPHSHLGGGQVPPKQRGENQIDPVAQRLRGAGSAQR